MPKLKVEYCKFHNCSQFIITDEDGWDPPDYLLLRGLVSLDACERLIQVWLNQLGDPGLGTVAAANLSQTRSWLRRVAGLFRSEASALRARTFRVAPLTTRLTLTFQLQGLQVQGDSRTISTPRAVTTSGEQAAIATLLQDAALRADALSEFAGGHAARSPAARSPVAKSRVP